MVEEKILNYIVSVNKEDLDKLIDEKSSNIDEEAILYLKEIVEACQCVLCNDLKSKLSRKEIVDAEETCKNIIENQLKIKKFKL